MIDTILECCWIGAKAALACIIIYLSVMVVLHVRAVLRLRFYQRQGAVLYPGCKSPFFGNMWDLVEYSRVCKNEHTVVPGPY